MSSFSSRFFSVYFKSTLVLLRQGFPLFMRFVTACVCFVVLSTNVATKCSGTHALLQAVLMQVVRNIADRTLHNKMCRNLRPPQPKGTVHRMTHFLGSITLYSGPLRDLAYSNRIILLSFCMNSTPENWDLRFSRWRRCACWSPGL
jgi:hypothetical protein